MWVRGCTRTLTWHPASRSCRTSDHTYQQAPYQDIEREEYLEWQQSVRYLKSTGRRLSEYEREDNTSGSRELACTAGVCEVVDLNAA